MSEIIKKYIIDPSDVKRLNDNTVMLSSNWKKNAKEYPQKGKPCSFTLNMSL